jgi:hypothetical protein
MLSHSGQWFERNQGVLVNQRLQHLGEVFPHMLSHTQKHGDNTDLGATRINQLLHSIVQAGAAQFQVCTGHTSAWQLPFDPQGNILHGAMPKRVSGSMGK